LKKTTKKLSLIQIWRSTLELIFSSPKVLIPFCIVASFGFFALAILYFAPHFPLSKIFAPIISEFWGEQMLHYPRFYILLIKLVTHAETAIAVIIGSLTTAMAVFLVSKYDKSEKLNLKLAFKFCFRKYLILAIVVFIFVIFSRYAIKVPAWLLSKYFTSGRTSLLWISAKVWIRYILLVLNFVVIALSQGIFVFTIPYIIIKKKGLLKAIFGSIFLFIRKILVVFPLVFAPLIIYIPIVILKGNHSFLLDRMSPEFLIAPLLFFSIIVSAIFIDLLITISTTILFLQVNDEEKK